MSSATCCWPSCTERRHGYLEVCRTHAEKVWHYIEDEDAERRRVDAASAPVPRLKAHQRDGWIYYLEVHGRLKIGFATHLPSRLRSYPPGTVVLASKRGTMADEQAEHQRCTPWRVAGREWYELNDATRAIAAEAEAAEQARWAAENPHVTQYVRPPVKRPLREEDRTD